MVERHLKCITRGYHVGDIVFLKHVVNFSGREIVVFFYDDEDIMARKTVKNLENLEDELADLKAV